MTEQLPEADGYCHECGGMVLFLKGETDTRCFNYECGAIVRRLPERIECKLKPRFD